MEQPAGLGHGVVVEEDHDRPAGVADAGVARTRQAAPLLVRDHPDRRAPLGAGPAEEVLIMIDHENHLERRRRLLQHRPDGLAQDRPAPFGVGADDDGRRRRRFSGGGIVGGRCHDARSIAPCSAARGLRSPTRTAGAPDRAPARRIRPSRRDHAGGRVRWICRTSVRRVAIWAGPHRGRLAHAPRRGRRTAASPGWNPPAAGRSRPVPRRSGQERAFPLLAGLGRCPAFRWVHKAASARFQ